MGEGFPWMKVSRVGSFLNSGLSCTEVPSSTLVGRTRKFKRRLELSLGNTKNNTLLLQQCKQGDSDPKFSQLISLQI